MKDIIVDKCSTIMADAVDSLLKTGEIQPSVFFGNGENLQQMDLSIPDSPIEKIRLVHNLRNQAAKMSAEYVIFISDSWTSKQIETQPSLDPKKSEAIVMTCQFGNISFVTIQEYTRTEDNHIILGDIHTDDATSGIFTSILSKSATKHVESNV